MGTRFILGLAGSGKSHFLHERLVEYAQQDPLNHSVILIVPRQATFTAERAIATDPRMGGFVNIRVIAPDDLGELALVETGAAAGAKLDAVGRGLILSHLLRTHAGELVHFGRSATQAGLAAEIDSAFTEFERAGQDLCDIENLAKDARDSQDTFQQSLARKLDDLCKLYTLYQNYLKSHGFDVFNRQALAAGAIERCELIQNALVLVDDFYDFTVHERSLITAVAKVAQQTYISLLIDPDSVIARSPHHVPPAESLMHRTEMTYRKLHFELTKADIAVESPLLLKDHPRFRSPELAAIERGARGTIKPVTDLGAVKRILATDPNDEVNSAAREINALLAAGLRMRDICVLARSIDTHEALINASFGEHGISYFVDKRRQATHHPLARTLTSILLIVQSRWSAEAVVELARSGLTPIDTRDAELLEDYIRQHNVPPSHWLIDEPWTFHRPVEGDELGTRSQFTENEIARVNEARVTLRKAMSTVGSGEWASGNFSVKQRVHDVFTVLDELGVRGRMRVLIEKAEKALQIQDRDEHLQVWNHITELADQIVELLGDISLNGLQFAQLMHQSLAEMELAITPPTLDQVLVGSIERTRPREPRAVILLGMNAGQFPLAQSEKTILNDRDRQTLQQAGLEIAPPSRQAMLNERFLGYLALTRATERLILLRTDNDGRGNEMEPSPFWTQIDRCIDGVKPVSPAGPIERIGSSHQAVSHILGWARRQRGSVDRSDDSAGLYDWMARTPTQDIQKIRDRVWPVLRYDNAPLLSPAIAGTLFTKKLEASVSRFESFAACPFQHFARYGLRLQQPPDPDITAMDLGSLYHSVLERLIRRTIEKHIDFATTPELSQEQIREIAQKVGQELRNQVFLSSARNRYTLEQLERVVHRLIRSQQYIADRGVFRPGFAELVFEKNGRLEALTLKTPAENEVVLSGKIDRVDINLERGQYTVIDYKLRGEQLSPAYIAHGLMLQLLTYLLVIQENGKDLFHRPMTPAAALYVKLLRSIESTLDPAEDPLPETPEFHAKSRPRGLINAAAVDDLDASFSSTSASDVYAMRRKQDGSFYENGCDAVETNEFQQMIRFVERKIMELADKIIAGEIRVFPYLIGGDTPCSTCSFWTVCRFDRLINRYNVLPRMNRKEALAVIQEGGVP